MTLDRHASLSGDGGLPRRNSGSDGRFRQVLWPGEWARKEVEASAVPAEIRRRAKSTLAAIAAELEAPGVRPPAGRSTGSPSNIEAAGSTGIVGQYHCSILHSH